MKIVFSLLVILIAMQGIGYWAYKASQKETGTEKKQESQNSQAPKTAETPQKDSVESSEVVDLDLPENREKYANLLNLEGITYPLIQVEEVNGIVERTIHMGVRQWAWDPDQLEANLGEKVRLVVHNADITHSMEIPELRISAKIPGEGTIVEFLAEKKGTFDFACGVSCGEGHGSMKGKIVIK